MRDLRIILEGLAKAVDPILERGFRSDFSIAMKQGKDIVTSVDQEMDEAATIYLANAGFSPSKIVSEENGRGAEAAEYWLIDPLDGTREFAAGISECAFSAAFVVNGQIEGALVSNPLQGVRVLGVRNKGISCEVLTQSKSPRVEADNMLLVSRSEFQEGLFDDFPVGPTILPVGSIAYKLALVAAGLADCTISLRPKSPWDIAGGLGLIELAGGYASDLSGKPFSFTEARRRQTNGLIAMHRKNEETETLRAAALRRMKARGETAPA